MCFFLNKEGGGGEIRTNKDNSFTLTFARNPSVFPIGDNKASNSHSNPGATVHPHTAGVVVGVVVALSVVVVLIAIFYKRERR